MIDIQQGRGVLKTKLSFFYFFMLLDIILSTFVEPHLNTSNSSSNSINNTATIVIAIVQIVINFILNSLFLILMWQTVPLRYGMIYDLLRQFKLAMFINTLQLSLIIGERVYRLSILDMGNQSSAVLAEEYQVYYIIYYVKYIVYPFFYAILLESSLKLALPVYYNVKKWESV